MFKWKKKNIPFAWCLCIYKCVYVVYFRTLVVVFYYLLCFVLKLNPPPSPTIWCPTKRNWHEPHLRSQVFASFYLTNLFLINWCLWGGGLKERKGELWWGGVHMFYSRVFILNEPNAYIVVVFIKTTINWKMLPAKYKVKIKVSLEIYNAIEKDFFCFITIIT